MRRALAALGLADASEGIPPCHADLRVVAYQQADLVRNGDLTRDQAMAVIARRFPDLSRRRISQVLAQGLFESR